MLQPRVIPCLLLKGNGLVKSIKFKDYTYVGDPINAIKIFNEKEVDELIFLDIFATKEGNKIRFDMIEQIASECFMPVCYGGGINNIDAIKKIFFLGIEKVSISSYAIQNPEFIKEASDKFGSQSIVVCIDVKKDLFGNYEVLLNNGKKRYRNDPVQLAVKMQEMGVGELLINSIDKDGTCKGYDLKIISEISKNVDIPIIACGGAGSLADIKNIIISGASAAAAGSFFVFHGKHRAVLINYPEPNELKFLFDEVIMDCI